MFGVVLGFVLGGRLLRRRRGRRRWLLLLHLRAHLLGRLGRQGSLPLRSLGHAALRRGQLLGLVRLRPGLLGRLGIRLALGLQARRLFLGQLVLQALAIQFAARSGNVLATVFQQDLVMFAIELGQLHACVLQLRRDLGEVDQALGQVQVAWAILAAG